LKLATWNVNSINARLPHVLDFLKVAAPDVLLLQELKCEDTKFPHLEIKTAGYTAAVHGQKTYNGVAILARHEIKNIKTGLPGDEADTQARYIEADVSGLRVASIYLPNGNPVDRTPSSPLPPCEAWAGEGEEWQPNSCNSFSEKFMYKLKWFDRLIDHARTLLAEEVPAILGGDFNVIPEVRDCYDPAAWAGDALFRPETRKKWRMLCNLGFTDAFRAFNDKDGQYTFWDYQAGAWQKDNGLRIDHFLLSPQAADRAESCVIDKTPRGQEKASDHAPVILQLSN
jgi:exodeoxyribonuclease-3